MKINKVAIIVILIIAAALSLFGYFNIFSNPEVSYFIVGILATLLAIILTSKGASEVEKDWLDRREHPLPEKPCRLLINVLGNATLLLPGIQTVYWNPKPKGTEYRQHRYLGDIEEDKTENREILMHVYETFTLDFSHYKIIE